MYKGAGRYAAAHPGVLAAQKGRHLRGVILVALRFRSGSDPSKGCVTYHERFARRADAEEAMRRPLGPAVIWRGALDADADRVIGEQGDRAAMAAWLRARDRSWRRHCAPDVLAALDRFAQGGGACT